MLFGRGHLQTLLGLHRRCGPCARLCHTTTVWLRAPALGVLRSTRNSSVDIGPRSDGIDGRSTEIPRQLPDHRSRRQGDAQEGQCPSHDQGSASRPPSVDPVREFLRKRNVGDAEFWNIREAVDQLAELFIDLVLLDQDCFKEEDKWRELLQLIPDAKIVKNLEKKWAHSEDRASEDKWSDFKAEIRTSYSKDDRVSPRDFVDRLW